LIWVALLCVPFAICISYVATYGVNVPFYDDWDYIPIFTKAWQGTLSFGELWNFQHNVHRIFIPYCIQLITDSLTRYNVKADMFVGVGLLTVETACLLFLAYKRLTKENKSLFLLLPIPWLIFNLKQWEILLWAGTMPLFCINVFTVVTITLLDIIDVPNFLFVGAIISGFCATFSNFNGLLIWPLGLLLLFFKSNPSSGWRKRLTRPIFLIWFAAAIAVYAAFFSNFCSTFGGNSPTDSLTSMKDPLRALHFYLMVLGNVLAVHKSGSLAVGLFVFALSGWLLLSVSKGWVKNGQRLAAPAVLVLYGLITGWIIEIGRIKYGMEYAMSSRYACYGAVLCAAVYLFAISCQHRYQRIQNFIVVVTVLIIFGGTIKTMMDGYRIGEGHRNTNLIWQSQLKAFPEQTDDSLNYIYGAPWYIRQYASFLKSNHLSVFSAPDIKLSQLVPSDYKCSYRVEKINEVSSPPTSYMDHVVVNTHADPTIRISGFAVDMQKRKPCTAAFVVLDKDQEIPAAYGLTRHDVAKSLRRQDYLNSGFDATFRSSLLSPGKHTLSMKFILSDHSDYYLSPPITTLISTTK
jgi:hypothetical protein